MRYRNIFILFFTVFLICSKVFGQADTVFLVTVDFNKSSIKEFTTQLEKQTGFYFYYDINQFEGFEVTLTAKQMPLKKVLDQAFDKTDYYYAFDAERHIFLTKGDALSLSLPKDFFTGKQHSAEEIQVTVTESDGVDDIKSEQNKGLDSKIYEIGGPSVTSGQKTVTMDGYIKDTKTGEAIVGASVFIEKPRMGIVTDQFGYYSLTLPKGKYILNVQSIGMKDARRQIILNNDGKMNIDLEGTVMALKGVTISAQKISNVRGTQMGLQKIDIKTVKQVPVVFGEADILRVVMTLPGVKTIGEASTGFNVRGGSADQNLILFNDAPINNPAHFFGMFSSFNPEVVKDVDLYKSSVPARYGGRLSSVLNINSRDGNKKNFTGSAGIGLVTSRLNIEGPIVKDKTSFILAGRTTYANWLLKVLPDQYKDSKASFYDINLNISHEINKNNSIYLTSYVSEDHFNLNQDTLYGYKNENISLKWKHIFNNKVNGIFTTGYNKYEYNISSKKLEPSAYKLGFDINQTFFKAHFNYYLSNKHIIDFGVNTLYYKLHPGYYQPFNDKSLIKPDILNAEQALESALYVSDNYTITDAISVEGGIRFSMFNYLGAQNINTYTPGLPKTETNQLNTVSYAKGDIIKTYSGPEFRVSMRYALSDSFSLKLGYNTQRQYIHSLSNTLAIAPTDIWKLSDPNIKPQTGDQISLGLFKNLKSNTIETSIEVYYKHIKNYLDYKSGAQLVLNHHIETEVIGTKGKAYGAEFLIKKLTGKLNGWISYTWSRILIKTDDPTAGEIINRGVYYPANYDKPHDVAVTGNYRFSQRFSVSVNSTYSTGRPITLPVGVYYYGGSVRTLYADRNAYRIPNYFRTDISMNIYGNHKIHQLLHTSWTIGVYNVTARKNPYSVYYVSENGVTTGYKLSIFGSAIPFINLNISF